MRSGKMTMPYPTYPAMQRGESMGGLSHKFIWQSVTNTVDSSVCFAAGSLAPREPSGLPSDYRNYKKLPAAESIHPAAGSSL